MRSIYKQPFVLTIAVVAIACMVGCDTTVTEETATDETTTEETTTEETATAESPVRHIELEGQSNFRDLGGYETTDGQTVKWRSVFRTGELGQLSDADVKKLDELGVKTVVNFLLPEEIKKHGPDRLPSDVELIEDPITGDRSKELSLAAQGAISSGNFDELPAEINLEIHAILMGEAKDQYARLLRTLADPDKQPVAFHCSGGIHRTGTAAAILLSALGVPWETIRDDYLLTNVVTKDETRKTLEKLRAKAASSRNTPPEEVDMTNVEAFYILNAAYIDGALKAAEEEYGSMEAYIREGLGITDAEVAALRSELLE